MGSDPRRPVAGRPRVLFVGNDQSSPEIAASLLRRLVGNRVEIVTAGAQVAEPGGRADDILVQMGLNPASEERLSVRALNVADRVVVLGTGLDVAHVAGRRYEEWDVETEDLTELVRELSLDLLRPAPPVVQSRRARIRTLLRERSRRALSAVRHRLRRLGRPRRPR